MCIRDRQYSENNFNGVNCGIMDQFAIAMGKKDHAIFLDTAEMCIRYRINSAPDCGGILLVMREENMTLTHIPF